MKRVLVVLTIFFALVSLSAAQEARSFKNGFATRSAGNVYTVESYEDDGKGERADKELDGGDGPSKGDVIGLTESEKKRRVSRIICPDC